MALQTKIKHIDKRPNGVLRFRRRFPKDVAEALGESFLQVHVRNTAGLAFHREYQAIMDEFDRIVRETRERLLQEGRDDRTTQQKWHDALIAAAGLKQDVTGLDPEDPETGRLIIQSMKNKPEPMLAKALVFPLAPAPKPTLEDAIKLYRKDKQIEEGSKQDGDLNRIAARLKAILGAPDSLLLEEMTVEHRRRYLDYMLSAKKADGSPLALGSAKKETNILVALVNHALKELGLSARNQFADLPWPKESRDKMDQRDPMPDAVIKGVEAKLAADARKPEFLLIWRILRDTGAQGAEIVKLTISDIKLNHEVPHILIRPNKLRGTKTSNRVRAVPLSEDAQDAVKEAISLLKVAEDQDALFPDYAHQRGNDGVSASLNNYIQQFTDNRRVVVYSLRHRLRDMFIEVGAPEVVSQTFQGWAAESVSLSTYGGRDARLRVCREWLDKAIAKKMGQ